MQLFSYLTDLDELRETVLSKIWLTYRKNFSAIGKYISFFPYLTNCEDWGINSYLKLALLLSFISIDHLMQDKILKPFLSPTCSVKSEFHLHVFVLEIIVV